MEKQILEQLAALGHAQRLSVFRLLMRRYPDAVAAGEIAAALGLKGSTLSVYLGALRQAGLITQTAKGTSRLYRADTRSADALVGFLFEDCCRSRPETCLSRAAFGIEKNEDTTRVYNVLFICSGNSARSVIAESLLRDLAPERFAVYSAGTTPASHLNSVAVRMLADKGHDTSQLRAKHVSEFQSPGAPNFDFVFTVCDRAANEDCPAWPGQPISGHWGQPDPARVQGTEAEKMLAFQQVYGALSNRISAFAALPIGAMDRNSLQHSVDQMSHDTKEIQ
ncbi:arsenate reductase/protein-tyrosine-phosphatase family protein [Puniceibacterium confluentis]|uniref:arsenate reductase/protein-tyrosine-phosphatase family protein n=1 Tax=Puniceibacterium confluentis TaxID=1958944 RepID=UPI0011B46328|nr:helix-turn-helix domain-containing protein [Puniceibacterium confluentis]